MTGILAESTWPEVPDAGPLLVLPLGSCEQHGPHLPIGTDAMVAQAVARGVARLVRDTGTPVVEAPVLNYGASGEHEGFPGTLSLGQEALRSMLVELGRSARRWTGRLLVVNGHGGNLVPVVDAVRRLRYEGDDAAWSPCAVPGGDAHAGRTETSLMLALAPHAVRFDRAVAGDARPVRQLLDELRRVGMAGVSPSGVLGNPAGATAAEGAALLAEIVDRIAAAVQKWTPDPDGRLSLPADETAGSPR